MAIVKNPSQVPQADIVVFGGNGDLAMRKIMPALYYRLKDGQLPAKSRIIAVARLDLKQEEYIDQVHKALQDFIPAADYNDADWHVLKNILCYVKADARAEKGYDGLKEILAKNPQEARVFYLATPAEVFGEICQTLNKHGLITASTRIVLEKPIGYDLQTFRDINRQVLECCSESQIYRIDHYLGKETVQNLMVLRFANNLFERVWGGESIDHIQITVAETVGLEARAGYYEKSGALRDMVQNHLVQLLCLVAMEPPARIDADAVRDEKVKVLRSLRPVTVKDVEKVTVRGQYRSGAIGGKPVSGYLEELGKPASNTETFVAIKAHIDNWRWAGVPFYLRTGKRMMERYSEIVIQFRTVPHSIFPDQPTLANRLIIRLQPDERIQLEMVNKVPGPGGYRLKSTFLNLSLTEAFNVRSPEAYERLLMDVVRGNATLFMRSDEVEAAWHWAESILNSWEEASIRPKLYTSGSWGPADAFALMAQDGRKWHEDES